MLKSYSTTSFSPGVTELLLEDEVLLLLLEEEVLLLLLEKVFGFVVGNKSTHARHGLDRVHQ